MHLIRNATHSAAVDVLTGVGYALIPDPDQDVADPGPLTHSLHAHDWDDLVRRLSLVGFEPTDEADPGTWVELPDGRALLALYGAGPVHAATDPGELHQSAALCREALGV
ncbi:MAG: hypothetical protein IPL94_08785 [Tetrasphaera sp.]|nr:hypothetical protein [Tetrasphaera sp.]